MLYGHSIITRFTANLSLQRGTTGKQVFDFVNMISMSYFYKRTARNIFAGLIKPLQINVKLFTQSINRFAFKLTGTAILTSTHIKAFKVKCLLP